MSGDAKGGLKPPVYVDTDGGLKRLVASLRNQSAIAVDTESNPLFAYREKLCLIQVSTKSKDYIIDPLADIDLSLFVPILADPMIVKIFHDAEFDVLMLKRTLPVEIAGIFDTKVVATSLGMSTVGLAPILESFFDVKLDKQYQRSDWGRRPLTDGQLDYARYDTHFLLPLAADLRTRMHEADAINQLEIAAEIRRVEMLAPEPKVFNPDDFTRIKGWDRLSDAKRRVLRELFVMRHEIADRLDRPAFKVLPNEVLLLLAKKEPADEEELRRGKLMSTKLRERFGADAIAAIARGSKLSPLPDNKIHRSKKEQEKLTEDQREVYEQLRDWRKKVANKRDTDASLVLPRPMMFALARMRTRPTDREALRACGVLETWRLEYYGDGIAAALASKPSSSAVKRASASRKNGANRGRRRDRRSRASDSSPTDSGSSGRSTPK